MKSKTIFAAITALVLVTGPLAYAQGEYNNRGNDRRDNRGDERRDNRSDERRDNRGDWRRDERGAGPDHQFHRGDRLPPEYHNRQYVVDDWRGHNLSAPPRGYHWVQSGGDYVLAAIATGVILNMILSH